MNFSKNNWHYINHMPVLNQEILINPELSHACVSYILMSNSMDPDQTQQLSSLIWVPTFCKSSPQFPVIYILMPNSMGSDLTKRLSSLIRVQTICKKSPQLIVIYLSIISVCQTVRVQIRPNNCLIWVQTICKSTQQLPISYILMSNSMGPDQT